MAIKNRFRVAAFIVIFLIAAVFRAPLAFAGVDMITLQQVYINMPELTVFFYPEASDATEDSLDDAEITAVLNGEPLTTVETGPADKSNGITYMILVDESTSVTNAQLADMKDVVRRFSQTLTEKDRLILITFGTEVEVALSGGEDSETISAAIGRLNNKQEGTRFFDAINKAIEISENKVSGLPERKAAFVLSDAVDYNVGGYTVEEIIGKLKACNLPVYALGLPTGDKASLDAFGSIARSSGGNIDVVSGTVSSSFDRLLEYMDSTMSVSFKKDNNTASQQSEKLIISFKFPGKTIDKSVDVVPRNWIPDDVFPNVTSYAQSSEKTITLTFSENMLGAGDKDSYTVTFDGVNVPVAKAEYDKTAGKTVLTFDELYQGSYNVTVSGVTDESMEKNKLEYAFTLTCSGNPAPDQKGISPTQSARNAADSVSNERGVNAAAIIMGCAALVAIIVIIAYNVVKKRRTIVTVDGKVHFADSVEIKHHFSSPDASASVLNPISLIVADASGTVNRVDLDVSGSVFVGRSSMCNLYFDDPMLSRQHFVIEAENSEFFISDLNTVNGTFLNGVPVGKRRKLQHGDVITAGRIKLEFQCDR